MADGRIHWHESFSAALRIEFEDDLENIDIREEYLLGKEPMRIDNIIIKKEKHVKLRKNIGRIFRTYNLIEYKSPDDYMSVNDFYKLYGYACFYQANTVRVREIDPEDITLTYVCNRYPRAMLKHIQQVRKMKVEKYSGGIYYLTGDAFPIQLIVTNELPKEENFWMRSLRNDLKAGGEIEEVMEAYEHKKDFMWYQAVMDVIVRANWEEAEGAKKMCDALRELFAEELEECRAAGRKSGMEAGMEAGRKAGIEAGREEGEVLKLISIVCKKLLKGKNVAEIAEALEETEEIIAKICNVAEDYAPSYDVETIYTELKKQS